MRLKFVVLSALLGCLALFLGLDQGRTQNPNARPAENQGAARPQSPPASEPEAGLNERSRIDERFLLLDRNGDGILTADEMTDNLRLELAKWDVNKDAMIDLDEWRAYVKAFNAQRRRPAAGSGNGPRRPGQKSAPRPRFKKPARKPPAPGAARPSFNEGWPSRLGYDRPKRVSSEIPKLPGNTPKWFKEYDADGDGQVSFHEWKQKEDNEKEFWKYDLNGDGFITLEELIRSGQFTMDTNKRPPLQQIANRAAAGEFFYFEVTGTTGGNVWGTDIYTHSSLLSTAAVHAGVVRAGETGLVKVTILPGQPQYRTTTRNGVTSHAFGGWPRSYRVELAPR